MGAARPTGATTSWPPLGSGCSLRPCSSRSAAWTGQGSSGGELRRGSTTSMAENWKKSVPRTAYESISASWALRSPGLTRGHPIEKAGSSKPLRSGIRRALLLVTHAGDALHVPRGRGLARLVQGADGPGHVVLDLRRVSRDVRRLLRGD